MTFEKHLAAFQKAEIAARKAQAARDRAQNKFDFHQEIIKSEFPAEWRAYCQANGMSPDYDFGDTIC